jgi:hypothetical protein
MLGWIERIDPSRLTHVRVTPRFERGAGLGSTLAKRECDRRIEILVNPAVWEAILRLDGLDRLDASGPTLAGLPVVDGDDPVLLAAL